MKAIQLAKRILSKIKYEVYLEGKRLKFYTEVKSYCINNEFRDEEVIVSLASYPDRFHNLHIVIGSIFRQSVKPDRIILNLFEGEVKNDLPRELKLLQKQGIEIYFRKENFKPHNKYYYVMKENCDATVITIDDDHIYSQNMIKELMDTHKRFPDCVIACRGHRILFENGKPVKYNNWISNYDYPYQPSHAILATGVGGVLYPAGCLYYKVFDKDTIKELCLKQDDLWLKVMEALNGNKTVLCNQKIWNSTIPLRREQITGLMHDNVGKNINDIVWKDLLEHYQLTEKNFTE